MDEDYSNFKKLSKTQQLNQVIKQIYICTDKYDKNLKNKNILFIISNKSTVNSLQCIETKFRKENFYHLTGIIYNSSSKKGISKKFYTDSLSRRLSPQNIKTKNPKNTFLKLSILDNLIDISQNAKMIGIYDDTIKEKLFCEKVVGNVKYCMGLIREQNSKYYRPVTALKEDIRDITNKINPVIAIFVKEDNEEYYTNMTYLGRLGTLDILHKNKQLLKIVDFMELYSNINNKILDKK